MGPIRRPSMTRHLSMKSYCSRPKTITGFQTHTSPVLLGAVERAEFGNQEWVCATSVLEGVVIVEKAPEVEEAK